MPAPLPRPALSAGGFDLLDLRLGFDLGQGLVEALPYAVVFGRQVADHGRLIPAGSGDVAGTPRRETWRIVGG
jgi:hypothetical protein